jgi:putative membrane protein
MKACINNLRFGCIAKALCALGVATFIVSGLQAQGIAPDPSKSGGTLAAPSTNVSGLAQGFVKQAVRASLTEIALAKNVEGKSTKTNVQELAQLFLSDHKKNYEELQAIARAHQIPLDSTTEAINTEEIERLQKISAADFDKEYTKLMVKDHVDWIGIFAKAASQIQEPDIKQYAQTTLPALRIHLLRSEEAARSVGVDESTISSLLKDLPNEDGVVSK